MRGWPGRLLALLIVGACLAFTVVVLTRSPAPDGRYTPPVAFSSALAQGPAGPPSALFIGDSYTAGYGATKVDLGYACTAADAMGWTCNLDAQGGTGYLNNGHLDSTSNSPLPDRLAGDTKKYLADVVIVDAGRNDSLEPIGTVVKAMKTYLGRVHDAYPRARLVVIAPAYTYNTPKNYPWGVQFASEIRKAVKPYDGVVFEPLTEDWNGDRYTVKELSAKDGVHPSALGHRVWAARLIADLEDAGLGDVRAAAAAPADS